MDAPEVARLLDFPGRVAVVRGAGSGRGGGMGLRFAEGGGRVVVHYRTSRAGALEVAGLIGSDRAAARPGDLAKPGEARRLIAGTVEAFGRVDVLVNNAGIYPVTGLLDMTPAQWEEVIAANLSTVFHCTQAAARQMIAQGGGGAIVNITSIEADNPAPGHTHYTSAKAGVAMHTRTAAQELGTHGIRVNAGAPGLIWREGLDEAWPEGVDRYQKAAPLGRLRRPDDVADARLFLASPAARWVTGASLTVDGGVMTRQLF